MPIAQTGENVLFAMDRAPSGQHHLEAHVQIFYTGPADRFAWIVPVDGKPTLDVGSNRLFQALQRTTRPQFRVNLKDEGLCKDDAPQFVLGGGGSSAKKDAGAGNRDAGVDVAFRGDVGPYDATVLQAADLKALKQWLSDNEYFVSDQGDRLLADYVKEDKHFVALKLLPGRGTSEIQPIVMRFEGPSPCVPLRLTAVASVGDLRVNLWVLAQHRVVPQNYFEIKVSDARIDWLRGGLNYDDLVKQAANEAGGNAFAVDYVGPASVMAGTLPAPGAGSLDRVRAANTPPDAVDAIAGTGLARDATMMAILGRQIPVPKVLADRGVTAEQFYAQIRTFWSTDRAAFSPFDAAALAAEIDTGVVQPLVRAQALFARYPKLSRLATFISPEEMNLDPTFVENPNLPDVPAVRQVDGFRMCGARAYERCAAPIRLALPDGRDLWFKAPPGRGWCGNPATMDYDRARVDRMPALEVGWHREAIGEGAMRFDNRQAIGRAIEGQNDAVEMGCACALGKGRSGAAPLWLLGGGLGLALACRRRAK